jgi:hypothetical protein
MTTQHKNKNMQYCYSVITDRNKFIDFIQWLPELNEGEAYYASLFARKKYANSIANLKSDKGQLTRIVAQDKDWLFNKIQRMEVPLNAYRMKDGIVVPQEALALYITHNPRCLIKATKDSVKRLQDLSWSNYKTYQPHAEVMSCIQRSKSRTVWVDFDFDIPTDSYDKLIESLQKVINLSALRILKTRGGYHVLVKPQLVVSQYTTSWYNNIMAIDGCDIPNLGDNMIPVVGTYQGGFTPHFIL